MMKLALGISLRIVIDVEFGMVVEMLSRSFREHLFAIGSTECHGNS